jgi:tetratricopeptide (TPR) repeat protein
MRPYQKLTRPFRRLVLCAWIVCITVTAFAAAPDKAGDSPAANSLAALTKSGLDSYYNTNYDAAIRDFEKVLAARPDDPGAMNHLIAAYMFRELYRAGALNTTMYSGDSFISQKRPVAIDPKTRGKIVDLTERSLHICDERLQQNANDIDTLYQRGVARSLRAVYQGIVDKSWFPALRSAIGARSDHQRVLELRPGYTDAKTVVGVHNYVAGSLNWAVKAAISVVGLSGSRSKGLQYLREVANANVETTPDAKVALALFLRREQRYAEAMDVVRTLTAAYPHNYLFALEQANLLKDWGKNDEALAAYRKLLDDAAKGNFFEPRLEFANFDLAEILRGRGEIKEAADHYSSAVVFPNASPEMKQKSALGAGEMYDLLGKRDQAVKQYQAAISTDAATSLADDARKRIKTPYRKQ